MVEQLLDFDMNALQRLKGAYNRINYEEQKQVQPAICQVFREAYGENKNKYMCIITLVLVDQLAMKEYVKKQKKAALESKTERDNRTMEDQNMKFEE